MAIFGPEGLSPEILDTLAHSNLSLGTAQAPRQVTVSPTCSAPPLPSSRLRVGADSGSVWFWAVLSTLRLGVESVFLGDPGLLVWSLSRPGRSCLKIRWVLSYAASPSSELSPLLPEDSKALLP